MEVAQDDCTWLLHNGVAQGYCTMVLHKGVAQLYYALNSLYAFLLAFKNFAILVLIGL